MFANISIWQLLIILAIVLLVFGTKKLRGMGGDLGGAVSGFKKAMKDGAEEDQAQIDEAADDISATVDEKTKGKV